MSEQQQEPEAIAVIGMSGRFPGAANPDEFWQNLIAGKDGVTRFPGRTATDGSRYVGARSMMENPDLFDASFFNIYPKEAELMDPQHRVFLECAWEALEDGGYDPETFPGLIGVYAGLSLNTYLLNNLGSGGELARNYQVSEYQTMLGNDKDFLPVRVSYKLNLRGPSMTIQSACSTSLVAICQAATALLTYQCDMALTGGVSISFPQQRDYLYQEDGMVSPDGTCRAFDADAAGTVFGHGCGVVLLKRLSEAIADRDPILAVIKGWAVNNDGSDKIGFAAPGTERPGGRHRARTSVRRRRPVGGFLHRGPRHRHAARRPDRSRSADKGLPRRRRERKCLLRARHRQDPHRSPRLRRRCHRADQDHPTVPPRKDPGPAAFQGAESTHRFRRTARSLRSIRGSGLENRRKTAHRGRQRLRCWRHQRPRRDGGSSARSSNHVQPRPHGSCSFYQPARAPALGSDVEPNLADHLEVESRHLADVSHTLATGRRAFSHRRAIVASDLNEAVAKLREEANATRSLRPARHKSHSSSPAKVRNTSGMTRGIYESEPVFRDALRRMRHPAPPAHRSRHPLTLYPSDDEREAAERDIHRTALTQPCIFAVEYSLAKLWISWGIKPVAADRPQHRRIRGRGDRGNLHAGRRAAAARHPRPADAGSARRRHARHPRGRRRSAHCPRASTSPPSTARIFARSPDPMRRSPAYQKELDVAGNPLPPAEHLARVSLGDDGAHRRPLHR